MVVQRRGWMRDWTLTLGMSTFLLTLVGTFMTRSGVFNSVHSFTQSEIGPVFLIFIGIVLVYSVVLLAFRSHLLDQEARRTDGELGGRSTDRPASLLSREFAILVRAETRRFHDARTCVCTHRGRLLARYIQDHADLARL